MNNKPIKTVNKRLIEAGKPTQFKPGNNANPNGRPRKDACLTSLMKELLGEKSTWIAPGATSDDVSWRQMIVKALLTKAAQGDIRAIELVLDRTDGKVVQPIGGEGGKPIKTEIIVSSDTAKKLTKAILNGEGT